MDSKQRRTARRRDERLCKRVREETIAGPPGVPDHHLGINRPGSLRDWPKTLRWTLISTSLGGALTAAMSGMDIRLIPIFLAFAALIALPEIVPQPRQRRIAVFGTALVCILAVLLIGAPSPTQPSQRAGTDSGVIAAHAAATTTKVQIGQGGVFFDISDNRLVIFQDAELVVERIEGKLQISTVIRDSKGKTIGRIRRNEWEVFPAAWDRNYNEDALEIKNSLGEVVFQARIVGDVLQLQGEWYARNGTGARLVQVPDYPGVGAQLELSDERGVFSRKPRIKIRELFKYPSRDFFGELAG
jgi:hypothetical protein